MRSYRLTNSYPEPFRAVGTVAFHPTESRLFAQSGFLSKRSCFSWGTLHTLPLGSTEEQTHVSEQNVWRTPVLSPNGQLLAVAVHFHAETPVVYLRPPRAGEAIRGFRLGKPDDACPWVAFSPAGSIYVAVNLNGMHPRETCEADLFRLDPGEAIRVFDAPEAPKVPPYPEWTSDPATGLAVDGAFQRVVQFGHPLEYGCPPAFSADGRLMAVWPRAGAPRIIDTDAGRVVAHVLWPGPFRESREHFRLALSPDGSRLAMIGGGLLVCARIDGDGKPWRTKKPHGYVTAAAFHPDGRALIAVSRQGQAHRLDAVTGKTLATFDWQVGMLLCVACHPDGTTAAAGGEGGNVVVWDLDG